MPTNYLISNKYYLIQISNLQSSAQRTIDFPIRSKAGSPIDFEMKLKSFDEHSNR